MSSILQDMWHGMWTGFGVELSLLLLYAGWKLAHGKFAHKLHADHWFHKLGEHFE